MFTKNSDRIVLLGMLLLGLAVGALALYNHSHHVQRAMPALQNRDAAEHAAVSPPRLPAPRLPVHSVQSNPETEPTQTPGTTNFLARLRNGEEMPRLNSEQIEAYLAANGNSAGRLLAAFQATGDKKWLQEAKEQYPNDPAVAFTALFKSASPEERRQWLDTLKRAAPDNALADYLAANDYLKAGRTDEAVRELEAANAKPQLRDYESEQVQNTEEAYRSAGYSAAEAKAAAMSWLEVPQFASLKELTQQMMELAAAYRQAGDPASAQAVLQTGSTLGQRLATGQGTLIQDLVGMAVEKLALSAMDPASPYGTSGQTVKDRMEQLTQQRQTIKALTTSSAALLPALSEQDVLSFYQRRQLFGERPAMQWLVAKYGKQ